MRPALIYSILLSTLILTRFGGASIYAQELNSPRYQIESGTLILQPDLDRTSANYDLPASLGHDIQKKFEESGFVIVNSNADESSTNPYIRLQLNKSQLVFDSAEVSGESIQQSSIKLMGRGSANFLISLRQQEPFKNNFGATIKPTACDDVDAKCTPVLARVWKKADGFGYRAAGSTVRDFSTLQAFRPMFVEGPIGRSAILFEGNLPKTGTVVDLKFKLRPQTETQTGIYKSTVIITATADY